MPRKRGRTDTGSSSTSSNVTVTPPETSRGQRKTRAQTSPSTVSPKSPPRKTRRGATTTPDTPVRASPRRSRGSCSPTPSDSSSGITPRSRSGRKSRRGSTDSNASSVGNVSVASSSTPQRRSRRGSNSSGVSAASEHAQVTPPTTRSTPTTRQTGRGRKRNKSDSPPTVVSKKTNGASPQYSPKYPKRRRGSPQVAASPPSANGRSGRRRRGRGGVSETPPQEDLDGGTDDEESPPSGTGENSILQNSTDVIVNSSPVLQNDSSHTFNDVGENKDEASHTESVEDQTPQNLGNGVNKKEAESKNKLQEQQEQLHSEFSKAENSEKHKNIDSSKPVTNSVPTDLQDTADGRLSAQSDSELKAHECSAECEVSNLCTPDISATGSSSRVESTKRRQTSGESSDSGSPEVKPRRAVKRSKLSDSYATENKCDTSEKVDEDQKSRVPDIKCEKNDNAKTSERDESVPVIPKSKERKHVDNDVAREKPVENSEPETASLVEPCKSDSHGDQEMDTVSRAETFLESLGLTQEQNQEMCLILPVDVREMADERIVETLVEKLLDGNTTVNTMNAPRFNKFLRQLLTHYCGLDTTKESKHALCQRAVQWARDRKSVNLRHELELTLMSLYYSTLHYKQAETIASALFSETKKLQDKEKTVRACLCLSQVYHAMGNISKARANITTAKTEALKIYTPPDMQGELDLQSGIMQVAEGKDMETAYSYFKEAATGFTTRKQRSRALKYMLLSKIMVNRAEEGEKAVRSQSHVQDIDEGVEAMLAITSAANRSSLADFRKMREQYKDHLLGDMVVASVLDDLYTAMMEKNLLNIVLPYERLQIGHIAERIGLPREEVERRLSQMILDKRINAQLDHRDDCLYVYAKEDSDVVYQSGIKTLSQLDKTVSHLNRKVKKLL